MPEIPHPNAEELSDEEVLETAKDMALFLAKHIKIVIATLGHRGIVVSACDKSSLSIVLLSLKVPII